MTGVTDRLRVVIVEMKFEEIVDVEIVVRLRTVT